ncbi:hypothetical protein, partial [Staphylococcus hyicus]|uniref:hypothetical protein n=1 Tax=Staphylococcus hyicus TaxID=1284 RepID=UPI00313321E9
MCKDDSEIKADSSNVNTKTFKLMKLKNILPLNGNCVMKKISLNIILITIVIISSSCGLINNENSEENINETS